MKLYVFAFLGLFCVVGIAIEEFDKWILSKDVEPKLIHVDRSPESDLKYDICLYSLQGQTNEEPDTIGVHGPNDKRLCPNEQEMNGRSAEQLAADKALNKVFDRPAVDMSGTADAKIRVKDVTGETAYVTRKVKYKTVGGFGRLAAKTAEGKPRWDSFCLALVETVGEGEYAEDLIMCDRKKDVPKDKDGKFVFTCPRIDVCVAEQVKFKIVDPKRPKSGEGEYTHGKIGDTAPAKKTESQNEEGRPQSTH